MNFDEWVASGGGLELAITDAARALDAETLPTAGDSLDRAATRLHDDGAVWSDAELLDWYNDGYRELLDLSGALRRFRAFPVPPPRVMAITQEWEDRHADGPIGKVTQAVAGGYYQLLERWEIEQAVA